MGGHPAECLPVISARPSRRFVGREQQRYSLRAPQRLPLTRPPRRYGAPTTVWRRLTTWAEQSVSGKRSVAVATGVRSGRQRWCAYGVGGPSIGETLGVLEDRHERQAPMREDGLAIGPEERCIGELEWS